MATGTSHYHRTRVEQSRVARLHPDRDLKGIPIQTPRFSYSAELRSALIFASLLGAGTAAQYVLLATGVLDPDSDTRLILSFALGLGTVCAISSSLAFLMNLRHLLLLLALSAGLVAAGGLALEWTAVESLAKVIFATSAGLWIALMLTSISQVLLISMLIIIVDMWSVFMGPTKKMVESGGPWIDYLTINLPVFGADAASRLGASDIIFYALFVGCTLIWRLRRIATALALAISFIATMIVGVTLGIGVPALPLLAIFFLLANGDLLYTRFLEGPDERRGHGDGHDRMH
ncbi:MAG: hypothetical protein ACYC4D_06570 [Thermoleophilia bacterium]